MGGLLVADAAILLNTPPKPEPPPPGSVVVAGKYRSGSTLGTARQGSTPSMTNMTDVYSVASGSSTRVQKGGQRMLVTNVIGEFLSATSFYFHPGLCKGWLVDRYGFADVDAALDTPVSLFQG